MNIWHFLALLSFRIVVFVIGVMEVAEMVRDFPLGAAVWLCTVVTVVAVWLYVL